MAEIVHFPVRPARPMLRLVCDIDDLVEAETTAKGHAYIGNAMENMASANLELNAANMILLENGGDVAELVSDEVITSICHALISVIDAKGCRTADRPLRNAAAKAIADREGSQHGH
ncbi:UNVERIFIED_ORG: transcriptional antiterminator Rof (Rho-off) [Rhizobium esperanzae]